MTPSLVLLVALGGAAGAVARYTLSGRIQGRLGGTFPWGTAVVNASGCLLAGFVTGLLAGAVAGGAPPAAGWEAHELAGALLVPGFLGALTTFSGFAADGVRLGRTGEPGRALLYLGASLVLGTLTAGVGLMVGRLLS